MQVDWSNVRRDEEGDWYSHPDTWHRGVETRNGHLTVEDWRNMATFATAVADKLRAEDEERRIRDERLHAFVALKLDSATLIPNTLAEKAIAAVREFEKENPVD